MPNHLLKGSILFLAVLAWHPAVQAHPLDSFAIDQYVDLRIHSGQIALVHRIEFAEIPTAAELPKVDSDSNLSLSQEEINPYLSKMVETLLKEISVSASGTPVSMRYDKGEVLLEGIPVPKLRVITSYKGGLPDIPAAGLECELNLKHRASARGDRQIRLFCEGCFSLGSVSSSDPKQPPGMAPPVVREATALVYGHVTRWTLVPSETEHKPAIPDIQARTGTLSAAAPNPFLTLNPRGVEGGMDDLSQSASPRFAEGTQQKPSKESWADRNFRSMFTSGKKGGLSFLFFASLLSLVYGMAHAMEPGHGKTIVAAYLVGSKGTVTHAVLLALIVTFTHTFAVYILGIIALTNLDKVQGGILPLLECGSWALIVLMGLGLFLRYYRAYILGELADPTFHSHGFGRGHSHAPHSHGEASDHNHSHEHPHEHEHDHPHDHGEPHIHHDEHKHDHGHPNDHSHSHEEQPVLMAAKPTDEVRFMSLLTLGITGGIVPCPGALFVMMMALTSGHAAVGLYLITMFSVGLALALMTVGIVMVRSRKMMDRFSPNNRLVQLLPVLSSLVIVVVGSGFLLNGLLRHGILTINL
jgi:ABC-type nickel/cobalt efflux system permease component RcnA